jgi:hypothetical protein
MHTCLLRATEITEVLMPLLRLLLQRYRLIPGFPDGWKDDSAEVYDKIHSPEGSTDEDDAELKKFIARKDAGALER